ncbi:MAG TPA: DUF6475 domain-containing protein [Aquabacterium sp.]|nr:DUF6475 domain-containing protein [Aquabacterium sp.]
MTESEKPQLLSLIADVMAFYNRDTSAFALSVWWNACKPFTLDQVRKALTAHTTDAERGRFPPLPADLVRVLEGTKTDRSLIAWGKVLDAIQRVGAYTSVVFDDPLIHAAIEDLGGWIKTCRSEMAELGHVERRFCESYRAYAARPVPTEFPAKLCGCHELENRTNGQRVSPPMLIGDPVKAAEVLRLGGSGPKTQFTLASNVVHGLMLEGAQA